MRLGAPPEMFKICLNVDKSVFAGGQGGQPAEFYLVNKLLTKCRGTLSLHNLGLPVSESDSADDSFEQAPQVASRVASMNPNRGQSRGVKLNSSSPSAEWPGDDDAPQLLAPPGEKVPSEDVMVMEASQPQPLRLLEDSSSGARVNRECVQVASETTEEQSAVPSVLLHNDFTDLIHASKTGDYSSVVRPRRPSKGIEPASPPVKRRKRPRMNPAVPLSTQSESGDTKSQGSSVKYRKRALPGWFPTPHMFAKRALRSLDDTHIEKAHTCLDCNFTTESRAEFNSHCRSGHKGGVPVRLCPWCDYACKFKYNLKPHCAKRHGMGGESLDLVVHYAPVLFTS